VFTSRAWQQLRYIELSSLKQVYFIRSALGDRTTVCRRNLTLAFASPHLGDVPRDGGPDELGERVVADLTPLGIKAGLSCVCHGTEDHDITAKHEARGENKPERRERRRRSFFVEKRNATVMHG